MALEQYVKARAALKTDAGLFGVVVFGPYDASVEGVGDQEQSNAVEQLRVRLEGAFLDIFESAPEAVQIDIEQVDLELVQRIAEAQQALDDIAAVVEEIAEDAGYDLPNGDLPDYDDIPDVDATDFPNPDDIKIPWWPKA